MASARSVPADVTTMITDDYSVEETVSLAYRVLVCVRVAVAILVGLATVAATLGWV